MTESKSRQDWITDFHSAAAVHIATLDALAKLFRGKGMDEEARIVERVVVELELAGEPAERVERALPYLKSLRARMREIHEPELGDSVERVRRSLSRYADPTLVDTQEIDLDRDPVT